MTNLGTTTCLHAADLAPPSVEDSLDQKLCLRSNYHMLLGAMGATAYIETNWHQSIDMCLESRYHARTRKHEGRSRPLQMQSERTPNA